MPRDGSGNFSLSDPPFQFDTVADETVMNAVLADLAAALTASLAKDGQTTATADLPMGGNKLTNVANAAARNQYAAAGQVQDDSLKVLGSVSGTNTIAGSLTPAITAYATGMMIVFEPAGANTGAATVNVNGVGAKSITKLGATALVAGDLASGVPALIIYDGAAFQLLNPQTVHIADEYITNARLAHMAQATIKGRASGAGTGDATDLSAAQVATIIDYSAANVLTKLLTVDGAGSTLDADSVDGVGPFAVSTYTPTLTEIANLDSISNTGVAMYARFGSFVLVAGRGTLDVTTGGTTFGFRISLPVASNIANSQDLVGVMGWSHVPDTTGDNGVLSIIGGDSSNDEALVTALMGSDSGSVSFTYLFAYRVL